MIIPTCSFVRQRGAAGPLCDDDDDDDDDDSCPTGPTTTGCFHGLLI